MTHGSCFFFWGGGGVGGGIGYIVVIIVQRPLATHVSTPCDTAHNQHTHCVPSGGLRKWLLAMSVETRLCRLIHLIIGLFVIGLPPDDNIADVSHG